MSIVFHNYWVCANVHQSITIYKNINTHYWGNSSLYVLSNYITFHYTRYCLLPLSRTSLVHQYLATLSKLTMLIK